MKTSSSAEVKPPSKRARRGAVQKRRDGEAAAFEKLATEIANGLREGKYQAFDITFRKGRRRPEMTRFGWPINLKITFDSQDAP